MVAERIAASSGSATDLIRTTNGATIAQCAGATCKARVLTDALGPTSATRRRQRHHYTYASDNPMEAVGLGR
jgi:hypothetical protein